MTHDDMPDDTRLHELAQRLGQRAAERIDVQATTRKVLAELRQAPARRRTWIEVHWMRIAAAVVLLLGGGLVVRQVVPMADMSRHPNHYVADDLSDLTTDQLQDVLDRFDEIVGSGIVVPDSTDLREFDAQQLRDMLRSLEG